MLLVAKCLKFLNSKRPKKTQTISIIKHEKKIKYTLGCVGCLKAQKREEFGQTAWFILS